MPVLPTLSTPTADLARHQLFTHQPHELHALLPAGRSTAARPAQRRLAEHGGEPLDLLDSRTSRAMVQSAAATQRQKRGRDDDSDVNFAEEAGRMIIQVPFLSGCSVCPCGTSTPARQTLC